MTQHPSLKGGKTGVKFRSVLKRYEKIKELDDKEKWDDEKSSVYRLPKIKRLKFKVKKTKGPDEDKEAEKGTEDKGATAAKAGDTDAKKSEKKGK
jgi:small basic protein (TIGR04137 family)